MSFGLFAVPQVNEGMVVGTYELNSAKVWGNTSLEFNSIPSGAILCRIELVIINPFNSIDQTDIEIVSGDDVIMSKLCSDPGKSGIYTTTCNIEVDATLGITVNHNLRYSTSGDAVIRLYYYETTIKYVNLITSDYLEYMTSDGKNVMVRV